MYSKQEVKEANIKLHTQLADKYKQIEPHYRPENVERVRKIIENLKNTTNGDYLLDIGCGMGFIIDIAKNYFAHIKGIDITKEMLDKVETVSSKSKIEVMIAESDNMPFDNDSFDVCTAHALLHHLNELTPTINETYRVLKPGGIFYSDLDPNFYFWEYISKLPVDSHYSEVITREINAVKYKDQELEDKFNIQKEILNTSEPLKHIEGGFKEEYLLKIFYQAGFSKVTIKYEWFLGEGKYINDVVLSQSTHVLRNYLYEILPLSKHLFKYISVYAIK